MNIGIDFDNTLVNTIEVSKKFLDIYKPGNNLKSYHELPLEEEISFFSKYYLDIIKNLQVKPNAKKAISFFKKHRFKVYLITARGINPENRKEMISAVKAFLQANKLVFDEEIYMQDKKVKACLDNKIDIMIDDTDTVLNDLHESGIRVLKYGNISETYDYVLSWQEVIDYFRKEFKCE